MYACTRTDAAMTLQLYVTVVRCSQTGWIETATGLKKSLGSDGIGVGLTRRNPSLSLHFTAGPVVASGVVVVGGGGSGGGGGGRGGHSRVGGGAAAAAASAITESCGCCRCRRR